MILVCGNFCCRAWISVDVMFGLFTWYKSKRLRDVISPSESSWESASVDLERDNSSNAGRLFEVASA